MSASHDHLQWSRQILTSNSEAQEQESLDGKSITWSMVSEKMNTISTIGDLHGNID